MRCVHKLILYAFLRAFLPIVGLSFFVLITQFFLVYRGDLLSRILEYGTYVNLAYFIGVLAIKQVLPIATFLATLFLLVSLTTTRELSALRCVGISLTRILWPLSVFITCLSVIAFIANGYLVPRAYLNTHRLLYNIGKKPPKMCFKSDGCYHDIPNYSISVGKQSDELDMLQEVVIYHFPRSRKEILLTTAKYGKLRMTQDRNVCCLALHDGCHYLEIPTQGEPRFYQKSFKRQSLCIDVTELMSSLHTPAFHLMCGAKTIQQLTADITAMRLVLPTSSVSESIGIQQKIRKHNLAWHHIMAWSICCLLVYVLAILLSAVLQHKNQITLLVVGAFTIIGYYLIDILGVMWASRAMVNPFMGAWLANGCVLLAIFSLYMIDRIR